MSRTGPFSVDKQIYLVDYCININGELKIVHMNMLEKYYERHFLMEKFISDVTQDDGQPINSFVISSNWQHWKRRHTKHYDLWKKKSVGMLKSLIFQLAVRKVGFLMFWQTSRKRFQSFLVWQWQTEHTISLTSDHPVRSRPYAILLHYRKSVEKEIKGHAQSWRNRGVRFWLPDSDHLITWSLLTNKTMHSVCVFTSDFSILSLM